LVSPVVAFELWYGVPKSPRPEANASLVNTFFAGPVTRLAFEPEDAKVAGRLRASLEAVRELIGAHELLIAGQA
jgi:tRNA(fMet)-specific endonuclease VapC